MGFLKAFGGAIGGTFADQWKDYLVPMSGVPATAGIIPAVKVEQNNGRGSNTKGSSNIITNGSKIVVPDGYGLITMQDGGVTGCITEAGGFIFESNDPNAKSIFSGDGIINSLVKQSWDRFKYGGMPGSQQSAFYVNLKEIPNNRFGTQTVIRWFDSFLDTQAGAMARGSYSLKIVDPISFIKNFVPVQYLMSGEPFDFGDMDNEAGEQLFNEVINCLPKAFSIYTKNPEVTLIDMQTDQVGVGKALAQAIEEDYQWRGDRGLEMFKVALSIDYDEPTAELLEEVRRDDTEIRKAKKMGAAYGANMAGMMAAASGEAMKNAASNENGAMMGFMGMNMAQNQGANVMQNAYVMQQQQQAQEAETQTQGQSSNEEDPMEKLTKLKKMLDAGLITQEDYDKAKAKILGV